MCIKLLPQTEAIKIYPARILCACLNGFNDYVDRWLGNFWTRLPNQEEKY